MPHHHIPHYTEFINALHTACTKTYGMFVGALASIIGYFLPIKDIVHLLILFFILDVAFGYLAARKLRNERFSVKIIWSHTMPRMLMSVVLITGAYMWDTVYKQDVLSTYKMIGWFISGVLLYSIAENGYKMTNWAVFSKIGALFNQRTKDHTGMEIDKTDI